MQNDVFQDLIVSRHLVKVPINSNIRNEDIDILMIKSVVKVHRKMLVGHISRWRCHREICVIKTSHLQFPFWD